MISLESLARGGYNIVLIGWLLGSCGMAGQLRAGAVHCLQAVSHNAMVFR